MFYYRGVSKLHNKLSKTLLSSQLFFYSLLTSLMMYIFFYFSSYTSINDICSFLYCFLFTMYNKKKTSVVAYALITKEHKKNIWVYVLIESFIIYECWMVKFYPGDKIHCIGRGRAESMANLKIFLICRISISYTNKKWMISFLALLKKRCLTTFC